MSHSNCMSLPHKRNLLRTSNIQDRCQSKSSCHTAGAGTTCMKTTAHCNSPHKVKRLKTRKERNQIRGQEKNKSHTCPQHSRKVSSEKAQHHGCHCSHSVHSSRKEKTFAKPFAPQKPSMITKGRLTSIRGLLGYEVKSLDIERLVNEQIKKEKQRRQSMTHITSPIPPYPHSVPDSVQDCILDEVQEPVQKTENNTQSNIRAKKSSRTELSKETKLMIMSLPENNQLYSTPTEVYKKYLDIPETHSPKSHNEGNSEERISTSNKGHCLMNIQILESTSTMAGFPNMEVSQNKTDPSLSELNSGNGTLTYNVKQWEKISVSVKEVMKRLATQFCQTVEHQVPNRQRPLLAESRDVLLQSLQKRHGFHLQQNLSKLNPLRFPPNRKQTVVFSSEQIQKDCPHIHFSHGVGNEDSKHSRNMEIWTDNVMPHDYLTEEVKYDSDEGTSMKKCRVQTMKDFPSPVFPIQWLSCTDISLQLDESRTAVLPHDCSRAQHYPKTTVFQQDQALFQHVSPIHRAPRWADHIYEPFSQQLLEDAQRRGERMKHFDLELIFHQWKENTDPTLNIHQEYQIRKQKAPDAFLGESNFCSNQLQIQDIRERWAPTLISTSFPSEGFRYKPFFRFSHPSNSQYRSDWTGMNLSSRLNT